MQWLASAGASAPRPPAGRSDELSEWGPDSPSALPPEGLSDLEAARWEGKRLMLVVVAQTERLEGAARREQALVAALEEADQAINGADTDYVIRNTAEIIRAALASAPSEPAP